MIQDLSRRKFLKTAAVTSAGFAAGAVTSLSARSYSRIIGANDRLHIAVAGVRSRGLEHINAISSCQNTLVTHICDVDKRYLETASTHMQQKFKSVPAVEKDIRKLLELRDIDAITIATPDHWHAAMTIMGLQAGKHVYVEKPHSHNPREGLLVGEAQKKYGKLVQMGNQQRSSVHTIEAIHKIRDGVIGKPYLGKAWYTNNRGSIGYGKELPVPDYLDWELWQGPAPRRPYKDNIHPYHWHWFWHWGTGESLNNGTHEVDICLWALGVSYPNSVNADGDRYHFQDDWEFYDTFFINFKYDDKMITWEGRSCNNKMNYDRGRGVTIHGTNGTMLIDRDGYEIYNNSDEKIFAHFRREDISIGLSGGGQTTDNHMQNFVEAIRQRTKLHSPIDEANLCVTLLQYSNIAWKLGRTLNLNKTNGEILNDQEAISMCSRDYQPGWELRI